MEIFQARIYEEVSDPNVSKNYQIVYISGIIIFSIFLGQSLDIIPRKTNLNWLVVIGLFTIAFVQFSSYFKEKEIHKTLLGQLEISADNIKWVRKVILWQEIKSISISYRDYKGKSVNHFDDFENKKSTGIENEIFITIKNGEKFSANILIENPKVAQKLENILYEVIKTKDIDYENAKRMVHPANYKEHQVIKEIIKKRNKNSFNSSS